jgi:NitT/TauT family transport system permease protein
VSRRGQHFFAPFIGLLTFFGIWELYVRVANVPEFKLVRPSRAFREVWTARATYWSEGKSTIAVALAGFLLASAFACGLGSLLAQSRRLERAVLPVALLVVVTPLYAYFFAIMLWVGYGFPSLIIAVTIVCFPPMLFATVSGLRSADAGAIELLQSVSASRWEIFRKVQVPTALPQILSAAKLSAGLSLVGVTIGEPVAIVQTGLGQLIRKAASAGLEAVPQLWGAIFVLGIIGSLAYLLISAIESGVRRWHSLDYHSTHS